MSMKRATRNARRARARVSATSATSGNGQTRLAKDAITRMIADVAYFRAAQRGFAPGGEIGDWLAAEREIRGALEANCVVRQSGDGIVAQEWPRRGVPVETPPAAATGRRA
jgi:hypothetical protein